MRLEEIVFGVLMMALGGVITWFWSWYYYMKSRPAETSVRALISAAEAASREAALQELADGHTEVPKKRSRRSTGNAMVKQAQDIAPRMILELIKAYEGGRVFFMELEVCARAYQRIGDLLGDVFKAVRIAGDGAGQPMSPPWFEARDKAMAEGLAKAKQALLQKLG